MNAQTPCVVTQDLARNLNEIHDQESYAEAVQDRAQMIATELLQQGIATIYSPLIGAYVDVSAEDILDDAIEGGMFAFITKLCSSSSESFLEVRSGLYSELVNHLICSGIAENTMEQDVLNSEMDEAEAAIEAAKDEEYAA